MLGDFESNFFFYAKWIASFSISGKHHATDEEFLDFLAKATSHNKQKENDA